MRIAWSVPVRGEALASSRGDLVRARHLIEALRADGHVVVVIENEASVTARAGVAAYRRLRVVVPRAVALPARDIGRRIHARAHAERVASVARAQRADLIVETQVHFADSGARAARATGIPLVLDDCSPWQEELVLGCGLPSLARSAFRMQAKAATRLAVSSERLRQVLVEDGAPAHEIRVVPNASFASPSSPPSSDRVRAVDDRIVLVFVGSFQPWHGVELLVEAVARARRGLPLHVVLLGDGECRAAALAAADRLGIAERVLAPGAIASEDVPAYLAACDIGVLPGSNDYGQPMKLLEYAAAGLPAIAPDLPPVREVLEDGVTGLVFRAGDADDLARCIDLLATSDALRRRLGAAARARTVTTSWRDSAHLLLQDVPAA